MTNIKNGWDISVGRGHALAPDCRKTCFFVNTVGATRGRPPKKKVFRISRREITFFRLAATYFALQNLRATKGRPYDGLF